MQSSAISSCDKLTLLTPIGASYYATSKSLCPMLYQTLMDRGWRRSGTLLYLPDAARSCCPHYTIRLPVADFRPTRDQRQTLNRWNRFVLGQRFFDEMSRKHPKSKAEKKKSKADFDLLKTVHEAESDQLPSDVEPEHRFEVTLEPDTFTEEKYALFQNYQRHVHHESDSEITQLGFKRFLCSSSLHRHTEQHDTDTADKPLGSYHQCYRLNGRLIAMGVLDLLPHAVSGVYFIYHSDYEKFSLGKLSALREAALALEKDYTFYYMGYYIHSCKKMRYKGDYMPQYVLDFHSLEWNVLDEGMRALMERRKYASPSFEKRIAEASKEKDKPESPQTHNDETDAEAGSERTDDAASLNQVKPPAQNANADTNDKDKDNGSDPTVPPYPSPHLATTSSLSLLSLTMPGVMTLAELQSSPDIDLNSMYVFLGRNGVHQMQNLVSWEEGSLKDSSSLKGVVAEFAACVGADIVREAVVDLSR